MKVTAGATLNAPAEAVLAALRSREFLAAAIPGCQQLEVTGPGRCELTVSTAMTAISGTYLVRAEAIPPASGDAAEPDALTVRVSAIGGPGTVNAVIMVRLVSASETATELSYELDASVDGGLASIGQRMLAGLATRLASEFLSSLEAHLVAEREPEPPRPEQPSRPEQPPRPDGAGPQPESAQENGSLLSNDSQPVRADKRQDQVAGGRDRGIGVGKTGLLVGGAVGLAALAIGAAFGARRWSSGRPGRPSDGA